MSGKNKLLASIQNLNKIKSADSPIDPKPIIQESRESKKIGRPSQKKDGVKYVKIGGMIPEDTKLAMQKAMLDEFRGIHGTQDDFLDKAILHYLNHKKK